MRKAVEDDRVEVGIHPNFFQPSSHGDTINGIIEHVLNLSPRAISVRCHRHFSDGDIESTLTARGLRIDSNTCCHLKHGITPIKLATGLLRLPVFFEDDIHWVQGLPRQFSTHEAAFFSSGLKILNFHPFLVALNAPDAEFYLRHKHLISSLSADDSKLLRYGGLGSATFLIEAITSIQAAGHKFVTLSEMVDSLG